MVCLVSRTGRHLQRYDDLGRRQVVGCIPYRFKCSSDGTISDDLEGGWEVDESREEAALRESVEEAGVLGSVECELGRWNFISKSHGTFYEGYMFPLLVKEELDLWPEQNVRQRAWLNVKEARDVCQHWWMKEALDILVERLTSSLQQQKEQNMSICSLI
ncbi:NUDIX hydrolase domain - like 7 [Theobroma cacao]|nr:NUDIX hydrolase domain - like 7 [Theobroma cacao]